jgi:DNA-binding NarL/FixJ family response regulator
MEFRSEHPVLQARRDLLLVLLRDRPLLVAVAPRLLALSLAYQSGEAQSRGDRTIVTSRAEALAVLERRPGPWLLLVGEHLADGAGLELIRAVRTAEGPHRCLLLLTHNHRVLVRSALAAGADAVLLEDSIGRTGALVFAVEQVLRGHTFVDPALEAAGGAPGPSEELEELTGRELEVLRLVAQGCSNREIAEQLQIAPTTARDHVQDILRRLRVRTRAAAAVEGWRRGYCH